MKNFLLSLFFFFGLMSTSFGQLPNGTVSPNWSGTDLDGNLHNLYGDYLDQGISVVLDISATWCGPCWSYHNTNAMKNMYNTFGPPGTGDCQVIYAEGDPATNLQCLYGPTGCIGGTQGNWVTGTPYPIIHTDGPAIRNAMTITGYPTIYLISAQNKKVYRNSGSHPNFQRLQDWILGSFKMEANPVITNATCGGDGAINLNITAGYGAKTFAWSNGSTQQNLLNVDPGSYVCTITDANGYSIVTDDITVGGLPGGPVTAVQVGSVNPTCFGATNGSITMLAALGNGGFTYLWDDGQTTATKINCGAGEHNLTVTDALGCTFATLGTLEQPTALGSSVVANPIPCGQSTGSAIITASGGTGPYTYNIGTGPQSSGVFNNLNPGPYSFTILDNNGCNLPGNFTLNAIVGPTAQAAAQGGLTCTTTQTQVLGNGSSAGNNFTYLWTTTNGNIVSGQNQLNAIVSAAGTYTLQVTNTTNSCTSVASTIVTSNTTVPTVTVNNAALTCTTTTAQLCANTDATNTVVWVINGQNNSTTCVNVSAAGSYQANVTAPNGCVTSATSTVTSSAELPQISIQPAPSLTCTTTQVTLQGGLTGSPADFTILWTTSNGNIVSGNNTLNPVVNGDGVYNMAVTSNTNGCISNSQVTVDEIPNNLAVSSVNIVNDANNQNIGSITLVPGGGVGTLTFLWSNGATTQNITGIGAGSYSVAKTDGNGCNRSFGPFVVENTSSVDETKHITQLSISPNPASNQVSLEVNFVKNEEVNVQLVNNLGVQVISKSFNGNISETFDVSNLSSGVYMILLNGSNFRISRRLVVVR
jgi:hypothetical protein